jgi:hypothetical protein
MNAPMRTTEHDAPLPRSQPAWRLLGTAGAISGALAAGAATAVALIARAVDIDLAIDGTAIPIAAFAWWTIVATILGVLLVRLLGTRRRFITVTAATTALSLVPAIAAPDNTATRLVLVAAHLIAAAIVVPVLTRQLPGGNDHQVS